MWSLVILPVALFDSGDVCGLKGWSILHLKEGSSATVDAKRQLTVPAGTTSKVICINPTPHRRAPLEEEIRVVKWPL